MIDWKHPELVVKIAAYLKELPFHITMIGGGELEEKVHRLAEELGVTDKITFAGFRSPEEVRAAMEESEIYLVTSDRKEGWGAVVNEAMNSGCAGVADYFGIDPTIVRVIWALLACFYGTSILRYVIMALVVPEQPAGGGVIDVASEVREPSEKKEKYKGTEID